MVNELTAYQILSKLDKWFSRDGIKYTVTFTSYSIYNNFIIFCDKGNETKELFINGNLANL